VLFVGESQSSGVRGEGQLTVSQAVARGEETEVIALWKESLREADENPLQF
jgi:hypothetical protein